MAPQLKQMASARILPRHQGRSKPDYYNTESLPRLTVRRQVSTQILLTHRRTLPSDPATSIRGFGL